METRLRNVAAALLVIVAGFGLVACGETVDIAPATSVRTEVKPPEHQGYKDLAKAPRQADRPVKPFEHQLRTRSRG